jgi:hypothetical protein
MKLNCSSDVILFDNKSVSMAEQVSLGFPRSMRQYAHNVVRIDGKYYYAKKCSINTLINELVGSYYSSLIGLDVVDYKIGKTKSDISSLYALSEIFYKDDYSYTTVEDSVAGLRPDDTKAFTRGLGSIYVCDTSVLSLFHFQQLIDSVLKMTAVDLKMGQVDRYNYNVILRDDGYEKHLEKVFDFGWSYAVSIDDKKACYYNPFLVVKRNAISICGLARKYPQIKKTAAILSTTPLYDVLKNIESRFNIKIEDKDIPGYLEMDNVYSKLLRKL